MHARNKKILTSFAVGFLILSSVGVAAQDNGLVWDPDGEVKQLNATETFNVAYSSDGDTPSKPEHNQGEQVLGLEINGSYAYWLSYTSSASGTGEYYFEGYVRDIKAGEPLDQNPGRLATITTANVDMHPAFSITNEGSQERSYGNGKYLVWYSTYGTDTSGMVADGSGSAEIYTSNIGTSTQYFDFHVVEDNADSQAVYGMDSIYINGSEEIFFMTDRGTFLHNTSTHVNSQMVSHYLEGGRINAFGLNEDSFISYRTNTTTNISSVFRYGLVQYYNTSTGNWSYIYGNLLAKNDKYIAISNEQPNQWNNSVLIFTRENFRKMLDGTSGEYEYQPQALDYASLEIPFPEGVSTFEKGFYESGHWFFADKQTNQMYVYDENLSDLEANISDPWNTRDGFDTQFSGFVRDGTIYYMTFDDNEIFEYNSHVQIGESGCEPNFNPHTLQSFWETPNVCWLPIFVGRGLLVSIYQWLMLAILIAMPIAKETRSEIATMATIDGVLLIGMLIGTISPGFVAVAILSTILLSVYGMSGTDVEINNMGGGGI